MNRRTPKRDSKSLSVSCIESVAIVVRLSISDTVRNVESLRVLIRLYYPQYRRIAILP